MVKKNVVLKLIFLVIVLSISFISAASIDDELHVNLQVTDTDGDVLTGTFLFQFDIATDSGCSNVIYTNSTTLTTDSRGIISYYLPATSMNFQDQYYLCYYRNSSLIDTVKIARNPYAFTAKNVNVSGIIVDSNLNLSDYNLSANYLFGNGQYLTNLNASALDLSSYVPYTGANQNLVLGANNFSVNTNTLFVNSNTGRVGIGTESPSQKLEINGTLRFSSNTDLVQWAGGSNYGNQVNAGYSNLFGMYSPSYDFGILGWNGSDVIVPFYVDTSGSGATGRVGIGTTTPYAKLQIDGKDGDYGLVYLNSLDTSARGTLMRRGYYEYDSMDGAGNFYQSWGMRYNGTSGTWKRMYTSANKSLPYIQLGTNNQIVMGGTASNLTTDTSPTLSPNFYLDTQLDRVGINTITPQNTLNVIGDGNFTGNVYGTFVGDGSGLTNLNVSEINLDGYYTSSEIDSFGYWNDTYATFNKTYADTLYYGIDNPNNYYNSTTLSGVVSGSGNSGYVPVWNGTTSLTDSAIYQNGDNIGIGNTTPISRLHISNGNPGAISPGPTPTVWIEDDTTNYVGLFSPDANNAGIVFGSPTDGFGALISWNLNNDLMNIGTQNAGADLAFTSGNGVERVRILDTGRVGINTTTPQNTLNVVGDLNVTGYIYGDGSQLTGISTGHNADGNYLYNDSSTMYFNDTKLNETIDIRSNGTGVYVPYTGASQDINLGNKSLTTTGVIRGAIVPLTVDTAAATAAKTATLDGYTLTQGDFLAVNFTLGNTVANPTLDINGVGAKPIRLGTTNTSTTTMYSTVGGFMVFLYYDGTYFQLMGSQRTSDSDTYDRMYWGGAPVTAGATIYDYKLMMQSSDGRWYPLTLEEGTGTTKTVSTTQFLINSQILYYGTTTNVAAGSTLTNVYSEINTGYLAYTANQASWTSQAPIYLKGNITNGYFVLDNSGYTNFMTQTLPTSDDGYVYILLGQLYTTANFRLTQNHPMYEFKNGALREYTSPETDPVWNSEKTNYYNKTESDSMFINEGEEVNFTVNNTNYFDGYDSSFFMPLNNSVYGQFDFNGGWTSGGLSIINGNMYAQAGYFYDINSLAVSNLNVNGSIYPPEGFDNQFDIGNSTRRWNDANFGGTVTADAFIGDGSQLTGINGAFNSTSWNRSGTNVYLANTGDSVGIGTTSPTDKLSVYDGRINVREMTSSDYAVVEFGNNLGALRGGFFLAGSTASGYGGPDSLNLIHLVDGPLALGTNNGVDLFIQNGGNVGINTTTPQNTLNVVGDLNVTGTIYGATFDGVSSFWNESGSNLYPSDLTKNVGIKLSTYSYPLSVNGTIALYNSTGSSGLLLYHDSNSYVHNVKGNMYFYNAANTADIFYTNSVERMRISNTGNVGINTTTPQNTLNVLGSANVTGSMIIGSANITTELNGDVNVW